MLENFEEFLDRPRPSPAEGPAAVGAAVASAASAAAPASAAVFSAPNSAPVVQVVGGAPAASTPLSADEAPCFGTPTPSPAHSASAGRAPGSAASFTNATASAEQHQPCLQPVYERAALAGGAASGASGPASSTQVAASSSAVGHPEGRGGGSQGSVATWAEAAAVAASLGGSGGQVTAPAPAAAEFSSEGLRQRKSSMPHGASSPAPTPAGGGLHAAMDPASAGAARVGSASTPAGMDASVAAAASRGGYVRENTPSEITTAPPTPQATPPATHVPTTPATPNSGTLAGARFGGQQRAMGGANAAGRNLHMPMGANAAREADARNVPPPSEDELLLGSISRFLSFLLFCLVRTARACCSALVPPLPVLLLPACPSDCMWSRCRWRGGGCVGRFLRWIGNKFGWPFGRFLPCDCAPHCV